MTVTQKKEDTTPVTTGVPYEVKGLIVKIITPPQTFAGSDDSALPFRRRFEASVFYLPPTAENRRFQDKLYEHVLLDVHTYMPSAEIVKAQHYPGTLTFESLTVMFNATTKPYAIDKRPACTVPGTRAHIEHVNQAQHRVLGTGKAVKNPCEKCDCGPNAGLW